MEGTNSLTSNVTGIEEEQLRRKTVGGANAVGGINIAAAQDIQYQAF